MEALASYLRTRRFDARLTVNPRAAPCNYGHRGYLQSALTNTNLKVDCDLIHQTTLAR